MDKQTCLTEVRHACLRCVWARLATLWLTWQTHVTHWGVGHGCLGFEFPGGYCSVQKKRFLVLW
ncbi:MAG: hypothetical protein KatS3mg069_1481 [Meiothermus sp.]|nr:MAG: hypothetical protein KatS3mg069_1481 [Meiothermus sp.]